MRKEDVGIIRDIIFRLQQKKITNINAFLGFDACIDNIVRVVKNNGDKNDARYYSSSGQLGEFLINRDNKSCDLELQTKLSKAGGNMVITGNALGNLGVKVDCMGTFGLPDILPVFRSMSANCTLYSMGETIVSTALEFDDSKVIMFDPGLYNNLNWDGIKNLLGMDLIKQLFSGKQFISFLNWSEIEHSTAIWKGILDEILPSVLLPQVRPLFFTDFSDCSRRSTK